MIKATLKYTNCLADGKNVFRVLVDNGVEIVATKPPLFCSICPRVIVLFNNTKHMYDTLYNLNRMCIYEVALVRYRHLKEKEST